MRTKQLTNLAIAVMLLAITSCNNEGITNTGENVKSNAPTIRATIGEFNDANTDAKTKAGIIEEFVDYKDKGERFYWQQGDKIKLLFYNHIDPTKPPIEIDYFAKDPGEKRNTCDFYTPQGLQDLETGTYDIIGLYPADEWIPDYDEQDVLNAYEVSVEGTYNQEGYSSSHLSKVLFMVGSAEEVTVQEKGDYVIDINFEQVTSVVRFRITDYAIHEKENFTGPLKLDFLKVYSVDNHPFFVAESYFDAGDWRLKPKTYLDENDNEYIPYIDMLCVNVNAEFHQVGDSLQIDVFMPVLPTGPLGDSGKTMMIDLGLRYDDGEGTGEDLHRYFYGTDGGFSFEKDAALGFLSDGFVGGYSYYFDLRIRK